MSSEENAKKTWMDEVDFKDVSSLERQGFREYYTVKELVEEGKMAKIPQQNGVYLILFPENKKLGFNEGEKEAFDLNNQWVQGTRVIYIGKAGVLNGMGASNLRKRLREYMKWYQKKNNKHHGGRDIWQINNPGDLLVTWRVTEEDPRECERKLLARFDEMFREKEQKKENKKKQKKRLPFANHQS